MGEHALHDAHAVGLVRRDKAQIQVPHILAGQNPGTLLRRLRQQVGPRVVRHLALAQDIHRGAVGSAVRVQDQTRGVVRRRAGARRALHGLPGRLQTLLEGGTEGRRLLGRRRARGLRLACLHRQVLGPQRFVHDRLSRLQFVLVLVQFVPRGPPFQLSVRNHRQFFQQVGAASRVLLLAINVEGHFRAWCIL